MKINIAGGTGIMGQVHKPVFEKAGHEVILSGRSTSPSLEEAAENSDLTIVSVPISATIPLIQRIAPYCSAIMDFTGVKKEPTEAMLEYSPRNCEVAGLHPLYGNVNSIEGRTLVYCPTQKSGPKCNQVITALENSGARIKVMTPENHDMAMNIFQNVRTSMLESYALLVKELGMPIEDVYAISPPPTRIILDLIARQIDSKNDALYPEMSKFNPNTPGSIEALSHIISRSLIPTDLTQVPQQLRDFFGDQLLLAQERAKKLI